MGSLLVLFHLELDFLCIEEEGACWPAAQDDDEGYGDEENVDAMDMDNVGSCKGI